VKQRQRSGGRAAAPHVHASTLLVQLAHTLPAMTRAALAAMARGRRAAAAVDTIPAAAVAVAAAAGA